MNVFKCTFINLYSLMVAGLVLINTQISFSYIIHFSIFYTVKLSFFLSFSSAFASYCYKLMHLFRIFTLKNFLKRDF